LDEDSVSVVVVVVVAAAAAGLECGIGIDDGAGGHEGGSAFSTARSANIKMKTIP
jgi:hypothetical protein